MAVALVCLARLPARVCALCSVASSTLRGALPLASEVWESAAAEADKDFNKTTGRFHVMGACTLRITCRTLRFEYMQSVVCSVRIATTCTCSHEPHDSPCDV